MSDWPEGFETTFVETPRGRFRVISGGEGPDVWCLHGFPDTVETWAQILGPLAAMGFRVHALEMPGYSPQSLQATYALHALADTIVMVIESVCPGRPVVLVGHDWGAALSSVIAAQRPQLVTKLVMAAVPHVSRFLRPNPAQLKRSWYMGFFQLPVLPELRIREQQGAFLERLWRDWSPSWHFSEQDMAPLKQAFEDERVVQAALAYYRAMPGSIVRRYLPQGRAERAPCQVPTLAIAGRQDGCIGVEMFSDQERYFAAAYQLCIIDDAGHFMHRENPKAFLSALGSFLP